MELFSDNLDSIEQELELIKDSFIKTGPKGFIDSFEMLESFYKTMFDISGEEDAETVDLLLKNKKYRESKARERKLLRSKNIKNFIRDKEHHNSFSTKVLDLYNKEYKTYNSKPLYLREDQIIEIMCDFLNDEFNQADKFIELIENKRIYKLIPGEYNKELVLDDEYAYTLFDYITHNNFIVISNNKNIRDLNMMRILAHEFGHVADNFGRANVSRKDNSGYYWLSSYAEVYSMMYEKLFYDYLIKNRIFKENAGKRLSLYFDVIKDYFNNVQYLSELDDYLLQNERYKQEDNVVEQVQITEDGVMVIDPAIFNDFNANKLYSYGGLLAQYFSELKHNDPDMFNRMFSNFKTKRFGLFDFKIFEDIGTNEDEIIKIFDKGLAEVTTKKLILK